MGCGPLKLRKSILWSPPALGFFKFIVGGVARGKPGQRELEACFGIVRERFYLCSLNL